MAVDVGAVATDWPGVMGGGLASGAVLAFARAFAGWVVVARLVRPLHPRSRLDKRAHSTQGRRREMDIPVPPRRASVDSRVPKTACRPRGPPRSISECQHSVHRAPISASVWIHLSGTTGGTTKHWKLLHIFASLRRCNAGFRRARRESRAMRASECQAKLVMRIRGICSIHDRPRVARRCKGAAPFP